MPGVRPSPRDREPLRITRVERIHNDASCFYTMAGRLTDRVQSQLLDETPKFQRLGSAFRFVSFPAFFAFQEAEMKTRSRKKNSKKLNEMRCPYCGAPAVLRSADGIYRDNRKNTMLYVCARYPECDAYVRTHPGTRIPVGEMANGELRSLRRTAHHYFDQLHQSGYMSRQEAYRWLAGTLSAPLSQAHIGYLGEHYCRLVISRSRAFLASHAATGKSKEEVSA